MTGTTNQGILVVGGYGQVGTNIARQMAQLFNDRVIVSGRNAEKAQATADRIGHGARYRSVDVTAPEPDTALDGVGLVIVCLDQDDIGFAKTCLERGVHYVDISANHEFLSHVEELDDLANESQATAVLSVGVVPGLSNLLAAHAHGHLGGVDRIDIFVELGLGDEHGRAAIEWMLDNIDARYQVREKGSLRPVQSLRESRSFDLPDGAGRRVAYRFNFSDQHVLGATLDTPSVSSWVCFSSRALTWLVAKSARIGLGRLLRLRWLRNLVLWAVTRLRVGSDRCTVAVRAEAAADLPARGLIVSVSGRKEAEMTATVAVDTCRQILTGSLPHGVFHSEQVIELAPVLSALAREALDVSWQLARGQDDAPAPTTTTASPGNARTRLST